MPQAVEELLTEIRNFRHQYQRYYVYAVPTASKRCLASLRNIRKLTKEVEAELKANQQLKRMKGLYADLDQLLHIVEAEERANSSG